MGISIAPPHPWWSQSYKDSTITLFPCWENLCEGRGTNAMRWLQTYLPKKTNQCYAMYGLAPALSSIHIRKHQCTKPSDFNQSFYPPLLPPISLLSHYVKPRTGDKKKKTVIPLPHYLYCSSSFTLILSLFLLFKTWFREGINS